jgi:hypothetical protein
MIANMRHNCFKVSFAIDTWDSISCEHPVSLVMGEIEHSIEALNVCVWEAVPLNADVFSSVARNFVGLLLELLSSRDKESSKSTAFFQTMGLRVFVSAMNAQFALLQERKVETAVFSVDNLTPRHLRDLSRVVHAKRGWLLNDPLVREVEALFDKYEQWLHVISGRFEFLVVCRLNREQRTVCRLLLQLFWRARGDLHRSNSVRVVLQLVVFFTYSLPPIECGSDLFHSIARSL